ncbi:intraflagellar transport protein 57 homolog isoform X1 [Schistocerca gregaria]|uniref:intraflagellar transport protein 57 homolog isoform X1 n=1 Tax=Schistocerca gregaria TaxID=7010 RepID=UPI00211E6F97|nr:intraflagellar transport protein 57 homolog isoform X1 [Schistocerca gregaria]XP_049834685.1 intraflagellar transport protein 57 homolog isoform X1 [Schistocerca gregaria]
MEDDDEHVLRTPEKQDVGPGLAFMPFIVMEDLHDKLKLLNYDTEFIQTLKMKPLSRHYFAIKTNPGEQFYLFTSLAAWLIRKMGKIFEQPQEYDDPNSTISGILDVLRETGTPVTFPPNKLKQGYGEYAIFVLDHLVDAALKYAGFSWKKPQPAVEVEAEEEIEQLQENFEEEELAAEYTDEEDDDEENMLHVDDLHKLSFSNVATSEPQKLEEVLVSDMDVEKWKLEVERVLPQLKVTIKPDASDWRSRLEQMRKHRTGMEDALTSAQTQLSRLHTDVEHTLDKVASRERYLNAQLEPLLVQYRALKDEHSRLSTSYREMSARVAERTKILSQLSEELDAVKREMEERSSSMTDGTPLVNIKKAITKVKSEITSMDVRIGVLENSLLQARLRDKSQLQQDMNTPA